MTTWDPLPPVTPELPTKGGKFIDIEIFGSLSLGGDIISANWDGTTPLNLASADSGATAGFALDSSEGAIQVQKLFAEGGEIGSLDIVSNITLATGGVIRTASSGERIEITRTDKDRIRFFTGDNFEEVSGIVRSDVRGTDGTTRQLGTLIFAPFTTGDTGSTVISILSESENDSSIPPQILIQYGGGSSQTPEFKLGSSFKLMIEDGTAALPSLTFNSDVNTGMFLASPDLIGWSTGGAERIIIRAASFTPRPDNAMNLGTSGQRWVDVWAVDGSINTSDAAEKKNIGPLRFDATRFVKLLQASQFKRKGRKRWHTGFTAQDVKATLDTMNLDLAVYISPDVGPSGLRPTELIPILWEATDQIEDRITVLENILRENGLM